MTHRFTNAKLSESQPTLGAGKAPRNAPLATTMRKTLEEQARHSRNPVLRRGLGSVKRNS
jgi:hypothetical protein